MTLYWTINVYFNAVKTDKNDGFRYEFNDLGCEAAASRI